MMAAVLATVFRVSSASIAQHSPAKLTGAPSGQCTSPSGTCSRNPTRPPAAARSRRSARQNAPARAYPGAASSASRTEVTARRCASRDKAGEAAR